jgi:TPR repeat protein
VTNQVSRIGGNTSQMADGEPLTEKGGAPPAFPPVEASAIIPAEVAQPSAPAASAASDEATGAKPYTLAPAALRPIVRTPPAPPANPPLSTAETAALVARGDAYVSARDIASARLFYERAAEMGDGQAALRMGATFDPAFLGRSDLRGTTGDESKAFLWYRRARDLGEAEAGRLLKGLVPH